MSEHLIRFIYHSRVSNGISAGDIVQIYNKSIEKNAATGIGGMLFTDGRRFIQMVEGGRKVVSDLFAKIINDKRNYDVQLVSLSPISERFFVDWGMSLIKGSDKNCVELIRAATGSDWFIPDNMTAEEIEQLLLKLINLDNAASVSVYKRKLDEK